MNILKENRVIKKNLRSGQDKIYAYKLNKMPILPPRRGRGGDGYSKKKTSDLDHMGTLSRAFCFLLLPTSIFLNFDLVFSNLVKAFDSFYAIYRTDTTVITAHIISHTNIYVCLFLAHRKKLSM